MTAIKRIRQKLGITQGQLAELAGVSQATVSRWEDGMDPTLTRVEHIRSEAKARGLPWDDSWVFELIGEH